MDPSLLRDQPLPALDLVTSKAGSSEECIKAQALRENAPAPASPPTTPAQSTKELAYDKQKVFFVTDRPRSTKACGLFELPSALSGCIPRVFLKPFKEDKLAYSFDMRDTPGLEKGWTEVSIPKEWKDGSSRKRGEMGDDAKDTSEEAATHHIILLPGKNQRPSQDSEFYSQLREDIARREEEPEGQKKGYKKELLLYIHGYKTSFKNAIRTAGQLAFDLKKDAGPYGGAVLAYDWASLNSLVRYGRCLPGIDSDKDRAKHTAIRLADLLGDLAKNLPSETKLHIVAHSMGNYVLQEAVEEMARRGEELAKEAEELARRAEEMAKRAREGEITVARIRKMTRTVTFAAPDVDRENFTKMVNRIAVGEKPPVATLLCSHGDCALCFSSFLRNKLNLLCRKSWNLQAGLFDKGAGEDGHNRHPVFLKDLDTIDASGFAKDDYGHGYFSDNKSILEAISKIVNLSEGAKERMEPSKNSFIEEHDLFKCPNKCPECSTVTWYKIHSGSLEPNARPNGCWAYRLSHLKNCWDAKSAKWNARRKLQQ